MKNVNKYQTRFLFFCVSLKNGKKVVKKIDKRDNIFMSSKFIIFFSSIQRTVPDTAATADRTLIINRAGKFWFN